MVRKRIAIVGSGGFARELKWLINDINERSASYQVIGHIVSDLSRFTEHDSREELLGDYNWIEKNVKSIDCLAIGIGSPAARIKIANELSIAFPRIEWPALVHPSARMQGESCILEHGVIVCAGTIGTVNIRIGPHAMVNLACTIGHEAHIGKGCVLNPTVNISGGVTLEEGVLVGTGAQVLQYLTIGKNSTIGAGAVVTKNVMPGSTVVGIPAKALQRI